MAKRIITESLMAVSRRNRVQRLLESLCLGAFYGTLAAVPLILLRMAGFFPGIAAWEILSCLVLAGLVCGAVIGWILPLEAKFSAEKADAYSSQGPPVDGPAIDRKTAPNAH